MVAMNVLNAEEARQVEDIFNTLTHDVPDLNMLRAKAAAVVNIALEPEEADEMIKKAIAEVMFNKAGQRQKTRDFSQLRQEPMDNLLFIIDDELDLMKSKGGWARSVSPDAKQADGGRSA